MSFAKIITPVETRWNSLLMMIRSIIHLQIPLESIKENPRDIKENPKLVDAIPDREDFEILKNIVPILAKFESISQTLSADKNPTICLVVPKLHFINKFLQSMLNRRDQAESVKDLCQVEFDFSLSYSSDTNKYSV